MGDAFEFIFIEFVIVVYFKPLAKEIPERLI